jgi:hypothetical protein
LSARKQRWAHLATAPDQLTAEMWVELLRGQGIAAMIRPQDAVSFLGLSTMACQVLVPREHLAEAMQLLQQQTEGSGLSQP